jgi:Polyketide cyclase / dehydrase and lipid transport
MSKTTRPKAANLPAMATIRKEVLIYRRPGDVWAALRDWGALHTRLVPGFVVDARVEGEDRVVTFFNGAQARERIVSVDDDQHRLVWSIVESQLGFTHHNGAAQVLAENGATRFVWTADLLPHELAEPVAEFMQRGVETVKATLEE